MLLLFFPIPPDRCHRNLFNYFLMSTLVKQRVLSLRATAAALRLRRGQGRAADAFFQPNEHHEVQHDADRKGDDYIQDAVLLDEYRRGIDKHGEDDDADLHPAGGAAAAEQPENGGHAAQHVHTGDDVGVGIGAVQAAHQPCEEIGVGEFGGAQVLAVGEDEAEQQRTGKADDNKPAVQPEAVVVIDKKVDSRGDEQRVPHTVKDHKKFAEGDAGIQRQVADPVIAGGGHQLFYRKEQEQIDRQIQHIPCGGAPV